MDDFKYWLTELVMRILRHDGEIMIQQLYRHFNKKDELLYVGISLSAVARLGQHKEHANWFNTISRVEIETFDTRRQVVKAEKTAIQAECPLYNIHHSKKSSTPEYIKRIEDSKQDIYRVVTFEPTMTIKDAGNALGISESRMNKFIENKMINALQVGIRRSTRWGDKPMMRISGWAFIDFIEQLSAGKIDLIRCKL